MEQFIQKAATLVEAFPYIRSFRDKIVVVKYGGSTQPDDGGSDTILADLVFMETVGMRPVVVHGGGKEISRRLDDAGLESKWINGLRVTDVDSMQVVEDTLFGVVNRRIVEGIRSLEGCAIGMSAKEAGVMHVRKHDARAAPDGKPVDIGFVGDVHRVNPEPVRRACLEETIPVIAPIGLGPDGRSYNVNADTAAGEIARTLEAEKLVFLTDVNGILRDSADPESRISYVARRRRGEPHSGRYGKRRDDSEASGLCAFRERGREENPYHRRTGPARAAARSLYARGYRYRDCSMKRRRGPGRTQETQPTGSG